MLDPQTRSSRAYVSGVHLDGRKAVVALRGSGACFCDQPPVQGLQPGDRPAAGGARVNILSIIIDPTSMRCIPRSTTHSMVKRSQLCIQGSYLCPCAAGDYVLFDESAHAHALRCAPVSHMHRLNR